MLPTPSTRHTASLPIYEPAEDSFLLLDTLSHRSQTEYLSARFAASASSMPHVASPTPLIVEVGTGSGVVLAFLTAHAERIFGRQDVLSVGVDVNRFACGATVETVRRAVEGDAGDERVKEGRGRFAAMMQADLTSALVRGGVDVLVFNPPYVPTERVPDVRSGHGSDECGSDGDARASSSAARFARDSHLLELSYAGGADGMETTNRLLAQIPEVLSTRGVAYVLLCAQNRPAEVVAQIQAWPGGWTASIVGTSGQKAGWEKLSIVRIERGEEV